MYNKSQVDNELNTKANVISVYNKSQVDAELNKKANVISVYNKSQIDAELNKKANLNQVYNKAYVNTVLEKKANVEVVLNLAGGNLTGDVTTAMEVGTFTTKSLVSKEYADNIIPIQTAHNGKYLTTNGNSLSWVPGNSIIWDDVNITTIDTGSKQAGEKYDTKFGALYGNRRYLFWIEDYSFLSRGVDSPNNIGHNYTDVHMSMFNGFYQVGGLSPERNNANPRRFGFHGFLDITPKRNKLRYNYSQIGFSTSGSIHNHEDSKFMSFSVYGTNDNINFELLCSKNLTQYTAVGDWNTNMYYGAPNRPLWEANGYRGGYQTWYDFDKIGFYRKYRLQWDSFGDLKGDYSGGFHLEGAFPDEVTELRELEFG